MKYHGSKKHSIAFLLAAMLVLPPVSAQAVTFADINQAPWPGAEVSINKAAELGLVVGETINGKSYFKPKDPVSLTQSCQLAYKVLLETGKAKADSSIVEKWAVVMNTYKIQSWAHPAVSFCLENSIIQIADLSGFVKGELNVSANREQAAEILGRALEAGVPSLKASASATSFKDNASISADARPYIALLNAQKIVNGDDKGNFNPKKTLNRTETAVMVTNLYKVLDAAAAPAPAPVVPTSQSGKVAALTNFYVNFENSTAYYLYASTSIPVTLNGATSSISEVATLFKAPTAMNATLTLDGSSKITAMAVTADNVKESDVKATEGTITKITYDDDDYDGRLELDKKSSYFVRDVLNVLIEITDEDDKKKSYDWDELVELYEECKDEGNIIKVKLTLYPTGNIKKITGEITKEGSQSSGDLKGDKVGEITKLSYDDDDNSGEIKLGSSKYYIEDVTDINIKIDSKSKEWDDLWDLYEEYTDDDKELRAAIDLDDDDFVTDIRVSTKTVSNNATSNGEVSSVTFDEDDDKGSIKIGNTTYKTTEADVVEVDVADGDSEIGTWEELYDAYRDGKVMTLEVEVDGKEIVEVTGRVTKSKGYLDSFGDDFLKLEGKKSGATGKYIFTDYDRDDDEADWKKAAKNVSVSISGASGVSNLYDLYVNWLDDDSIDLGTKSDEDCFDLEIELNKDGYITKIKGSYK